MSVDLTDDIIRNIFEKVAKESDAWVHGCVYIYKAVRTHPHDCLVASRVLNELSLTTGIGYISRGTPASDILRGGRQNMQLTNKHSTKVILTLFSNYIIITPHGMTG